MNTLSNQNNKLKSYPLVSIITINYQQVDMTREFIQNLKELNYFNVEIIVVENGSPTGRIDPYDKGFEGTKVIFSSKNLGFSGGNNLGIKTAKGQYIFLVNNDTVLPKDCIEKMLLSFQSHPKAGAVSPKIKYFENPDMIQYAGFTNIHPVTGRNKTIGKFELDYGQFDKTNETFYAHGAAMMVKKEVISKIGNMPEEFFIYYEEMDWSEKIRKAGYQIIYTPETSILHKESVSTGKGSPLKTYYLIRNRILFMRRNRSKFHLILFMLYLSLVAAPKHIFKLVLQLKTNHLKAFLQGLRWHFFNTPYKVSTNSFFQS